MDDYFRHFLGLGWYSTYTRVGDKQNALARSCVDGQFSFFLNSRVD